MLLVLHLQDIKNKKTEVNLVLAASQIENIVGLVLFSSSRGAPGLSMKRECVTIQEIASHICALTSK